MILSGTFTFEGPRARVWDILQDPEVLAKALPGTKTLTKVGEDRYQGVMKVSVGPVNAAEFAIDVALKDKVAPETFAMQIDGKGGVGFTKGTATIALEEQPGPVTLMTYTSDVQIGGRIAAVGQRLLESVGKMMTKQALEALNKELKAEVEMRSMKEAAKRRWRGVPAIRMKPAPFEYFRPRSLDEALTLLAEHGGDAKPLAGGQSLIPAMNFRLATPSVLVDLNEIRELSYISDSEGGVRIGGMARQRAVERSSLVSERVPLITETMPHIAHPAIRNRGTDRRKPRACGSRGRTAGRHAGAESDPGREQRIGDARGSRGRIFRWVVLHCRPAGRALDGDSHSAAGRTERLCLPGDFEASRRFRAGRRGCGRRARRRGPVRPGPRGAAQCR